MFFLFAGDNYYPSGGWDDFHGVYPSKDQAVEAAANLEYCDWWHVVELASLSRVASGRCR